MSLALRDRPRAGVSTSVWLTAEEADLLRQAVGETNVSQNALIRVGLRRLLGLPRISSSRVEAILDDFAARPPTR